MGRKTKCILKENNKNIALLDEIYGDAYKVKNASVNIMRELSSKINYDDKEQVLSILPLVQSQMLIIESQNNIMLSIQAKLDVTL